MNDFSDSFQELFAICPRILAWISSRDSIEVIPGIPYIAPRVSHMISSDFPPVISLRICHVLSSIVFLRISAGVSSLIFLKGTRGFLLMSPGIIGVLLKVPHIVTPELGIAGIFS